VIVCGIDSEASLPAARFADLLRHVLGCRLILAHVVPMPEPHGPGRGCRAGASVAPEAVTRALREGTQRLETVRASGQLEDVALHTELGCAAHGLLGIARESEAELIVLGMHRRGAFHAAVRGSVAWAVTTGADCPVVLVPGDEGVAADGLGTIVCGLEDTGRARAAVRVADMLASWLGARLVLVHVAANPYLPGVSAAPGAATELRRRETEEGEELLAAIAAEEHLGSPFERRVVFGTPGGALADVAYEEDAGLVVVGSRGRGALASAVLGSVSAELIGSSLRPVMVVPPGFSLERHRAALALDAG
jgi:nucleotide-binding universal stress UspA family protein